jgi:hypothetical protein
MYYVIVGVVSFVAGVVLSYMKYQKELAFVHELYALKASAVNKAEQEVKEVL